MSKDQVEKIVARLDRSRKSLEPYKDKIHTLRSVVAGDPVSLVSKGNSDDMTDSDVKRAYTSRWPDQFVRDIEEGRANQILRAVRTLGQQVAYQFPEIEADDLPYEEANLHAEYFRQRLGPAPIGCDAVVHMRRALYDYLCGGMGWIWITMVSGKPVIRYIDTLDCSWDQQATTLGEATWWSCTMRSSLSKWQAMFGKNKFDKYLRQKKSEADLPVELEYYFDIEGDKGNWKVLFKTGDTDVDMTPVYEGPNPCSWDYGGQTVPFLPSECMFFMELPSVRLPIGLVEQMLPSAIALWETDRAISKIVNNPAFYDAEEDSYDPKQIQAFEDGKTGGFLFRKVGKMPITQHPAMDVPESLMARRSINAQEIVAQGGADPYASGAPVEGTSYAAEVNAIKAAAGLMAGTIAKENADCWIRVLRKFLAKGASSDEWPLVVRHEDVTLTFDESDPIRQYLRPDARFTIRESSTQFMDQQTKIQLAVADMDAAIKYATTPPSPAKDEAYGNYLRARGEKNVEKYLAPPPAAAPPLGETAPVTAAA